MKFIGVVHSPYQEKFSVPRQAHLVPIPMKIELHSPYNREEALDQLATFSHLIVLYQFHQIDEADEKLSIRPPRLGGNKKIGVFASRSPYRPNRIGFSIVKLESIKNGVLHILGGDFVNQTPILDIKPYLPLHDSIQNASNGWVIQNENELKLKVSFEQKIINEIAQDILKNVAKILEQDPRPSFHEDNYKDYGVKLYDYDFYFKIDGDVLTVFDYKLI